MIGHVSDKKGISSSPSQRQQLEHKVPAASLKNSSRRSRWVASTLAGASRPAASSWPACPLRQQAHLQIEHGQQAQQTSTPANITWPASTPAAPLCIPSSPPTGGCDPRLGRARLRVSTQWDLHTLCLFSPSTLVHFSVHTPASRNCLCV